MPVESKPVDPRATFNYAIEIDGLEVALVRSVQLPKIEVGKMEHSQAGVVHSTKTAGKLMFDDLVLEKVMPADATDKWAWDWLKTVRNPNNGRSSGALAYKKDVTIVHYGNSNDVIDKWEVKGAYPIALEYSANDASQDAEPEIETVTLSIDMYDRV